MSKPTQVHGLWDDLVRNGFSTIVALADVLPSDGHVSSVQFAELLLGTEKFSALTKGERRRQLKLYKSILEEHLGPSADVALFRT